MRLDGGGDYLWALVNSIPRKLRGVALLRVAWGGGRGVVHALGWAAVGFLGAGVRAALVGERLLVAATTAVAVGRTRSVAGRHGVA